MDRDLAAAWLIRGVQQPQLEPGQEATSLGTLEIVALTAEYRRLATAEAATELTAGGHNWRVAQLAALLAKTLGVSEEESLLIKQAAPLHDIGTIFIPEHILRKPAKLSLEEFAVVKRHVELGSRLLQASDSALLQTARTIIETHHERFDGSGYPLGKMGTAIPLTGQVVAVADVFDTLTHPQPYRRQSLSAAAALYLLREARGKEFAPNVIDAFVSLLAERYWLVRELVDKSEPAKSEVGQADKPKQNVLLEGKLGILNLFDLLGSLTQNKTSGAFHLDFGTTRGLILLNEGLILHADIDGLTGEEALLVMFSKAEMTTEATFKLEAWQDTLTSALMTIETPTEKLLFDIAVKLDHELAKRNNESQ
jgi:hypothetical protein